MLSGKKIILGVTGSIAAYKSAVLLRLLVKAGAEVQVVITKAGKEFITPVTLSALSGRPVLGDFFENKDGTWHSHVDLGLWADLFLIAPATANTMGKMVTGICDNLLITTYLSARCPVIIAPAMDLDMFLHPSTKQNMETLQQWGCKIIDPGTGELASGLSGKGRMEEPEIILERIVEFFQQNEEKPLANKKILLTAGPTHEPIDPVRFIGNHSSGKMGIALAEELAKQGAKVHLVIGPTNVSTSHPNVERVDVTTAQEMYEKCMAIFPQTDAAIMAAAVGDYTPTEPLTEKLKREDKETLTIKLKSNPDIAAELGKIKTDKQILVGFALETENEEENARKKLNKKNLDFIVLNSLKNPGAGFSTETNQITIIDNKNNIKNFTLKDKTEVAKDIITELKSLL